MLPEELKDAIERDHRALDRLVNGDATAKKQMFSRKDDVTLANPLGPPVRGRAAVENAVDAAASQLRDAQPIEFERVSEYASRDLAYILEFERWRGQAGAMERVMPLAVRATTIYRLEDGEWRIALRQADAITAPVSAESLFDQASMQASR